MQHHGHPEDEEQSFAAISYVNNDKVNETTVVEPADVEEEEEDA